MMVNLTELPATCLRTGPFMPPGHPLRDGHPHRSEVAGRQVQDVEWRFGLRLRLTT